MTLKGGFRHILKGRHLISLSLLLINLLGFYLRIGAASVHMYFYMGRVRLLFLILVLN